MLGNWDDDEYVYFTDREIEMLHALRRYGNEEGEPITINGFNEWDGSYFTAKNIRRALRNWTDAVKAAGFKSGQQTKGKDYPLEKTIELIETAAEQRLEYKIDGESIVSPEAEAVPVSHFGHIDELDLPCLPTVLRVTGREYIELVEGLGYSHPQPSHSGRDPGRDYDWEEIEERLVNDIESHIEWRDGLRVSKEGETPDWAYFESDPDFDYPSRTQLRRRFGSKDQWKEELGISEQRNADDVNVDPTDLGL